MKVAITSQGTDMSSAVDPRLGRAKCFVVVDTKTGKFEAHDNTQNLNALQGAGIQAGRNIIDLGIEAVITGSVGPKAFATLQAGGARRFMSELAALLTEAFEKFKAGELECVSQANVEGHWV